MINWIMQCGEWLTDVLPEWSNVLNILMEYSWVELVDRFFIDPLAPGLYPIAPLFFNVWDIVSEWLGGVTWMGSPIVNWLIINSALIMCVYMSVYFVKWIIGIFT